MRYLLFLIVLFAPCAVQAGELKTHTHDNGDGTFQEYRQEAGDTDWDYTWIPLGPKQGLVQDLITGDVYEVKDKGKEFTTGKFKIKKGALYRSGRKAHRAEGDWPDGSFKEHTR